MQKLLLNIFFSIQLNVLFGQLAIPELKNSLWDTSAIKFQQVKDLMRKSTIILSYHSWSNWSSGQFQLVTFEFDNLWHSYILLDSTKSSQTNFNRAFNYIQERQVDQDSLKNIWQAFVENEIFTIRDDNSINCRTEVFDGPHYEISIITRDKYKVLNYYSPDTFNNACPGSIDRQKFLSLLKVSYR